MVIAAGRQPSALRIAPREDEITRYAAPPPVVPATFASAAVELLGARDTGSFSTASTYIDTIGGDLFRFFQSFSLLPRAQRHRIHQQRQPPAGAATGAPCHSNYRHAHLFFSPYSPINQSRSSRGGKIIKSPLLEICSRANREHAVRRAPSWTRRWNALSTQHQEKLLCNSMET